MNTKITLEDGTIIEVQSAKEAAEFYLALKGLSPIAPTTLSQKAFVDKPANGTKRLDAQALQWTVRFLTALVQAGPSGALTERLLSSVDVTHVKAIGGRMAVINRILIEAGFPHAYTSVKTPEGRIWKMRKNTDTALVRVNQLISEQ